MTDEPQTTLATWAPLVLSLGVLLQSMGPLIVKDATASGFTFAFHRLWMATAMLVVVALVLRRRIDRRALVASLPAGALFAVQIGLFFSAVQNTSVANATVLVSTHPLLLVFVSARMFGERGRRSDAWLALVAVGGVGLVVFGAASGSGGSIDGDLLALAAMVLFSAHLAAAKRARAELDAVTFQVSYTLIATVCIVPLVLLSGQGVDVADDGDWLLFGLMALLPGLGHLCMNAAHPYVRLVVVSLALLTVPPITAVLAWILLDETLAVAQIVGIAVVLVALGLVVVRSEGAGGGRAAARAARRASLARLSRR